MSTSLLVNKMKEAAAAEGKDYQIAAFSLGEAPNEAPKADCILIGPQVRFALDKLKAYGKPIDSIDMRIYGLMDGKGALAIAKKLLGEE
jgi:PTS system cellobiose-specific IIB component